MRNIFWYFYFCLFFSWDLESYVKFLLNPVYSWFTDKFDFYKITNFSSLGVNRSLKPVDLK